MRDRAQYLASRLKGADFRIDDRVPLGVVARVGAYTVLTIVYGHLRFPLRATRPRMAPSARVANAGNVRFGKGVSLQSRSFIDGLTESGIVIGSGSSVGKNTRIEGSGSLRHLGKGLKVGKNVGLGTDCFYGCAGGIVIGDDTIVGNLVTFHSENHAIEETDISIRQQGVTHLGIAIGKDCWIGAKATILDGAEIGDGCVIAAGSVVTKGSYEENAVYGGIPARLLGKRAKSTQVQGSEA